MNAANTAPTVAQTIANQIGARAFRMLGAWNLYGDDRKLMFRIRGSRKANSVVVFLRDDDTYDVGFHMVTGLRSGNPQVREVSREEGVYVDSLHRVIESHTGLYTSL
jgi:hypothetical protein